MGNKLNKLIVNEILSVSKECEESSLCALVSATS